MTGLANGYIPLSIHYFVVLSEAKNLIFIVLVCNEGFFAALRMTGLANAIYRRPYTILSTFLFQPDQTPRVCRGLGLAPQGLSP
jgi:hypothetical protein